MVDIGSEVRDGLFGVFLPLGAGGVHVPAGRQLLVVGELIEEFPQKSGVGIGAAGLHQNGDGETDGNFHEDGQSFDAGVVVLAVRVDADGGDIQVHGHFHGFGELIEEVFGSEVGDRVQTGDAEALVLKVPAGGRRVLRVRDGGLLPEDGGRHVIDFDALHSGVLGDVAEFLPAGVRPVLDAKG